MRRPAPSIRGGSAPGAAAAPAAVAVAVVAAVAAAVALGACGGSGDDEPGGPDPNEVLACVQDAGVRGVATGGDEALGTSGGLRLDVSEDNRIVVDFFEDAEAALSYSDGQGAFLGGAGGGGTSEVVDETVVIGSFGPGAEEQIAIVKGCLG